MKTYLYLSTAIISVSLATSENAWAQCVSTQDCTALGYTESSCPNGKGVKCPFGSKWFCGGDSTTICKQEGFTNACTGAGQCGLGEACANLYKQCGNSTNYKYTCSGTGYSGGTGSACNGKYTQCKCASGYKWNAVSGACIPDIAVCAVGWLYYSDNTCSSNLESDKTLLGVVIYSNGSSGGGWVMTVRPIERSIKWSTKYVNIPELPDYTSWSTAAKDFDSCGNTDKIRAQGDSSTYPAAWAAYNYQPSGTPTGKHWCLPAAGLINSLYNNMSAINTAIGKAGGTSVDGAESIWSSTEYSSSGVWVLWANHSGGLDHENKDRDTVYYSVRPVMEF